MATPLQCLRTLLQWGHHREEQLKHTIRYTTEYNSSLLFFQWCIHDALSQLNVLVISLRCPRCHGYVETPPCSNRLRGNAVSARRSAPGSTHSCSGLWRGIPQTRVTTSIRSTISANQKAHLSYRAGGKTTGPKRSALPHIPLRKQYSGIQPSDSNNTLNTSLPHKPKLPTPSFLWLVLICPCTSHQEQWKSHSEHQRGLSLMSKDNGGYHSNISACSGCHVFLSSLVIFDIFLFPVTGFL